jgi:hypothetical protein
VATDDQQVLVTGIASAPATFTIPGNGQIQPKAVYAHYDGSGAGSAFLPALKVTSDGGELVGIYPVAQTVAAGGSAEVSWFPRVSGAPLEVTSVEVTDGTTTVTSVTEIDFTSGAKVSSGGAGVADVAIPTTPSGSIGGYAVYGDGSDGSPTFDGSTVVLGITPSGNTYTLARDVFLAAPTINNGVSIITNGFRVFARDTLTNNGTIKWDGNDATANTGGGGVSNANSSFNTGSTSANQPGTGGGQGNTGAGSVGVSQSTSSRGSYGGNGGNGGTGSSGGGTGGVVVARTSIMGEIRYVVPALMLQFVTGNFATSTQAFGVMGGAGGGGGGGDGAAAGGHGGGGGGVVGVYARLIAGTGTISANGGKGGTMAAGNVGGGGGGGGGLVVVLSGSASAGSVTGQTITANGGAKGSPHGGGTDNAQAGSPGTVLVIAN